jgi:hypothetical protein
MIHALEDPLRIQVGLGDQALDAGLLSCFCSSRTSALAWLHTLCAGFHSHIAARQFGLAGAECAPAGYYVLAKLRI